MQGQNGVVNSYVVIIFSHYILSDKVVLELKRGTERASQADGADALKR